MAHEEKANSILKTVLSIVLKIIYLLIVFYVGMYLTSVSSSSSRSKTRSYAYQCKQCGTGFRNAKDLLSDGICIECMADRSMKDFADRIRRETGR